MPLDAESLLGSGKTAGPPPQKMLQSPRCLSGRPCPCPFQSGIFQCWLFSVRRLLSPHQAQCPWGTVFKPPPLGRGRCPKSQQIGQGTFLKHSRAFLALPLLELGLWGNGLLRLPNSPPWSSSSPSIYQNWTHLYPLPHYNLSSDQLHQVLG